jgi:hypothetical protein
MVRFRVANDRCTLRSSSSNCAIALRARPFGSHYFFGVIGVRAGDLIINRAVGLVAHLLQNAAGLGHLICLGTGGRREGGLGR